MSIKAEHHVWSPISPMETPYKKAKAEWDSRMGAVVVQAKHWRLAALMSLGLLLLALGGLIFLGTLPKVEPHIVEVNSKTGQAVYRGRAAARWSLGEPPRVVITYHLSRFIVNVRELSTDAAVVKRQLLDAYTLLTREAATMLNETFRANNPLDQVGKKRVTVEIKAMVPISASSWQCDWTETSWNPHGTITSVVDWRGMFRIALKKPRTQEQLEKNPIGLYIKEFHWSQVKR